MLCARPSADPPSGVRQAVEAWPLWLDLIALRLGHGNDVGRDNQPQEEIYSVLGLVGWTTARLQ